MQKLFCERTCYLCGKEFIVPDRAAWLYKINLYGKNGDRTKYFCSYSCKKKWEQNKNEGNVSAQKE